MAWETKRIKDVIQLKARIGWKGLRSDEFQTKSYAYLVTGQDFNSAEIVWKDCYQIDKERYDEDPYIQLNNGDVLVTKDGTIGKVAMVNGLDKPACLNSGVFVLKQKKEFFKQKYLFWELSSNIFKEFIKKNTDGSTIQHLYQNVFDFMNLLIPPLETQQKIADYLDVKTQNIDRRIELLQKKKELYITLRKAIINEAVNGEGKDWKNCRMKDIGYLYSGLSGKSGEDFQDDENTNNKSFIPFTNIFNNDVINPQQLGHVIMLPDEEQNKVQKNDLFFLMSSEDYDGLGKNSLLKDDLEDTYLNSFCKGFRITAKNIYPEFLNYLLQSFDYRNKLKIEGKGFTRMNLKSEKVACFTIRYPDIQIQRNIVKMLDRKTKQIDDIIKNINYQTETLKTYRRALINEAVTGKLNIE